MSPDDPRHGTSRGYYAHRRANQTACDACKRAAATSEAVRQVRISRGIQAHIPALGMQRRLQALVRLGYSWQALGDALGRSDASAQKLATDPRAFIHIDTYRRVADVYERLSMRLPVGETPHKRRAITLARAKGERNGWPPPLAWDDIDDPNERPIVGRDRSYYTAAELASEWRWLERSGESIEQAARQLGVTVGAIEKALERAGRDAA